MESKTRARHGVSHTFRSLSDFALCDLVSPYGCGAVMPLGAPGGGEGWGAYGPKIGGGITSTSGGRQSMQQTRLYIMCRVPCVLQRRRPFSEMNPLDGFGVSGRRAVTRRCIRPRSVLMLSCLVMTSHGFMAPTAQVRAPRQVRATPPQQRHSSPLVRWVLHRLGSRLCSRCRVPCTHSVSSLLCRPLIPPSLLNMNVVTVP